MSPGGTRGPPGVTSGAAPSRRSRRDGELLAEGLLEQLALALGRPTGDRYVLVGLEPQLDAAVAHLDARGAHGLVARALELLAEAQQCGAARHEPVVAITRERGERPERRVALAVIAGDLPDQRGLARRVAGQPGVQDQVARMLVVVVVVDRGPDVV